MNIVAVGECMAELTEDKTNLYRMDFAGDVYNTAVYLRRMLGASAQVRFVTATGDDWLSDKQLTRMSAEDLQVKAVRVPGASPALYLVRTDPLGERAFTYYRDASPMKYLLGVDWDRSLISYFESSRLVYFSAITLQTMAELARERLWDLLARARAQGAVIAFDSNYRRNGWKSVELARVAIDQAKALTDIALPSLSDELSLDSGTSPDAVIESYRAAGVREIVLKDGAGDVKCFVDGHAIKYPIQPVQPIDTTGAGDSFNAGYLAHRLTGDTVENSLEAAAKLASVVVMARGAIVDPSATAHLTIGGDSERE